MSDIVTELRMAEEQPDVGMLVDQLDDGLLGRAADEIERLRGNIAASGGLQCPNSGCNNQGWYPQQIADDEWEQVQCEFCYCVDDSVYERTCAAEDKS